MIGINLLLWGGGKNVPLFCFSRSFDLEEWSHPCLTVVCVIAMAVDMIGWWTCCPIWGDVMMVDQVIVGVVPLWGDCPMRLSHSGIVPSLRLSHSWHCLLWGSMGMPVPYQGDIRCCLCISGCWGPPRYLCGWSTAPSIQVKNLVENLTVFFSSWFAMVGNLFSDVCLCIHRTIGGFMNVVCVLFFSFQLFAQLFFALFWHGFCSCGCVFPVYWSYWLIVLMGLHDYPRMTWGFQIGIRRGCDGASGSLVRLIALLFSSLPTQGVLYVSLKSLLLG